MHNDLQRKRTHPGEILLELYMKPLNLTVSALAQALGVSRKTVSAIVNQRTGITPDMALRLSRAFATTPDVWLAVQRNYDLWCAQQEDEAWRLVTPIPALREDRAVLAV